MKNIFLSLFLLYAAMSSVAQKQSFDIANFTPPEGWTKALKEDFVSFSRIDGASWSQIAVYKSRQSGGNIEEDALKDWQDIVLAGHTVENEDKTEEKSTESWQVMSRSGVWKYNGTNVATLLTTYSNGNVCISVLWNGTAKPYMDNLKDFIASIDLDTNTTPVQQNNGGNIDDNTNQNTVNNKGKTNTNSTSSITGLWTSYVLETNGYSTNGTPQYTAGYLRKEYNFYPNGTYLFRNKQWLVKAPNIVFEYETGTYTVNGNQLMLTPKTGKSGFWNKTKSTKEWGSLIKSSGFTQEKTTYTFQIIIDNTYGNSIVLTSTKPTQRDGGKFNAPSEPYEFHYRFRTLESDIDNPPGWNF